MDLKTVCSKGTKLRQRRRIGRGIGSGSGKTSGRGHKGWGARSGTSRRPGYEGGQMPIYRRVPKRGFTNARFGVDYTVINVDTLGAFADGETVDFAAILARGLASKTAPLLKVLGNGALSKRLTVRAQKFSASARSKIEAAGGSVVDLDERGREIPAPQVASSAAAEAKAAPAGDAKSKKASTGEAKPKKPRGSGEQK